METLKEGSTLLLGLPALPYPPVLAFFAFSSFFIKIFNYRAIACKKVDYISWLKINVFLLFSKSACISHKSLKVLLFIS